MWRPLKSTWRVPCSSSHKQCRQSQSRAGWSRLFDGNALSIVYCSDFMEWYPKLCHDVILFCCSAQTPYFFAETNKPASLLSECVYVPSLLNSHWINQPWYIGMGQVVHMKAVVLDFVEAEGTRTHLIMIMKRKKIENEIASSDSFYSLISPQRDAQQCWGHGSLQYSEQGWEIFKNLNLDFYVSY